MSEQDTALLHREIKVPPYLRFGKVVAYALYAWVAIGIALLTLRVFLLAFSASVAAPFVQFVYRTSDDYLQPFRGIFSSRQVGETGYLDVAALFAIVMYLFFSWAVGALISYIQYKSDKIVTEQKEQQEARRLEQLAEESEVVIRPKRGRSRA